MMKLNKKKVAKIYCLWLNGEKMEAAKRVASVNRRELVELVCNYQRYERGLEISMNKDLRYNFEVFVEGVMAGDFDHLVCHEDFEERKHVG